MSQLLEICYCEPSENPTKGPAQPHRRNSAINTTPESKMKEWIDFIFSITLALLDPTVTIFAVNTGTCWLCVLVGKDVLAICCSSGAGLRLSFRLLLITLSPHAGCIGVRWGTKQTIWVGETGWNGVGSVNPTPSAPRRVTCDPVGQKP